MKISKINIISWYILIFESVALAIISSYKLMKINKDEKRKIQQMNSRHTHTYIYIYIYIYNHP